MNGAGSQTSGTIVRNPRARPSEAAGNVHTKSVHRSGGAGGGAGAGRSLASSAHSSAARTSGAGTPSPQALRLHPRMDALGSPPPAPLSEPFVPSVVAAPLKVPRRLPDKPAPDALPTAPLGGPRSYAAATGAGDAFGNGPNSTPSELVNLPRQAWQTFAPDPSALAAPPPVTAAPQGVDGKQAQTPPSRAQDADPVAPSRLAAPPRPDHVMNVPTPDERDRQPIQLAAQRAAEGAQAWAQFARGFDGDPAILAFLQRFSPPDRAAAQAMAQLAQWACGIPEGSPVASPDASPASTPMQSPSQRPSFAAAATGRRVSLSPAAGGLGPQAPGVCPLRPEQFRALCVAFDELLPAFVRQHQGPRLLGALRALAEAGVTAERLRMACRWALVRDHLSQLVASVAGYSASFMTYNTLLYHLWGQDDAAATVPVSALTLGSMTMQRLLRMGEMMPGWTRTVEPEPLQDRPVPHILTARGFAKVASQYWPFLISLSYAAYALDLPREQVLALRNWGFAATGGVAAHRMFIFHRDFPWLDAGTPRARQAMLQSIEDLCGWQSTFTDLATYALVRPFAGQDLLQYVEPRPQPLPQAAAVAGDGRAMSSAQEELDIPPRRPASLCEELSQSIYRAASFGVPMLVFSFTKQLGAALGLHRQVVSTLHFSALVPGWGMAMAKGERLVVEDPTIQQENAARAAHQQAVRARRHADAAAASAAGARSGVGLGVRPGAGTGVGLGR